VLNGRGLYAEAELAARQAMSEVEPATECEHALPLLRRCLAASLNGQGQYAEAELELRDLRPEGAVAIVSVRTHLAAAQLGLGNLGEAEAGAREAEETGKHRLSPRHYLTLTAGTLLGTVLARQGRPDEARRQLQDNAAAWAEYFGDAHPRTIAARTELAM
jgi:ATP/maltotriose-dependent transcriptional regulator MalT